MRVAYLEAAPERRRGIAFLLVVLVHLLLAFVLLKLTPEISRLRETNPKVFELLPSIAPPKAKAPAPKAVRKPEVKPVVKKATAPMPPPIVKMPPVEEKLFETQLFEAVDISKLPNQKEAMASAADGAGSDSSLAEGTGTGPGGEKLYRAEWAREPTNAELAFYVKTAPRGAWAVIACRTAPRNLVEDCRAMGDSPPGSGLARAIVEAAWQFRVRPPRVGGKALVGSWVQIRIDFSEEAARG